MMWTRAALGLSIASCLSFAACGDRDQVRTYRVPEEATPPAGEPAASESERGGGEYAWTTPEHWESSPGSSMRLASFSVPVEGGGSGDCSIIVLAGNGGGLVNNVNRWRNQLGLPPESEAQILANSRARNGRLGEFRTFRLENPDAPDRGFLVAILPHAGRTLFVKLAAPSGALETLEPDFLALCTSVGPS